MNLVFVLVAALASTTALPQSQPSAPETAQSWSCTPRKTCPQILTCAEARWYLQQCSWGGRLDGDHDGIPCEKLCGSAP